MIYMTFCISSTVLISLDVRVFYSTIISSSRCHTVCKLYQCASVPVRLKQAGMQSACGFRKVDNVIDGVQGRNDRFKMTGCAMIVGKVFDRGTRVGCEGGADHVSAHR